MTNTVKFEERGTVAKFECACGEDIRVEVGTVGERSRPICECGRAFLVQFNAPAAGRDGVTVVASLDD